MLNYQTIDPISHDEALQALADRDAPRIATALIALGLHDHDWRYVQDLALRHLTHGEEIVVKAAIVAMGHTARLNRALDVDRVVPALVDLAKDPRFSGHVADTLDDIGMFVGKCPTSADQS